MTDFTTINMVACSVHAIAKARVAKWSTQQLNEMPRPKNAPCPLPWEPKPPLNMHGSMGPSPLSTTPAVEGSSHAKHEIDLFSRFHRIQDL